MDSLRIRSGRRLILAAGAFLLPPQLLPLPATRSFLLFNPAARCNTIAGQHVELPKHRSAACSACQLGRYTSSTSRSTSTRHYFFLAAAVAAEDQEERHGTLSLSPSDAKGPSSLLADIGDPALVNGDAPPRPGPTESSAATEQSREPRRWGRLLRPRGLTRALALGGKRIGRAFRQGAGKDSSASWDDVDDDEHETARRSQQQQQQRSLAENTGDEVRTASRALLQVLFARTR